MNYRKKKQKKCRLYYQYRHKVVYFNNRGMNTLSGIFQYLDYGTGKLSRKGSSKTGSTSQQLPRQIGITRTSSFFLTGDT